MSAIGFRFVRQHGETTAAFCKRALCILDQSDDVTMPDGIEACVHLAVSDHTDTLEVICYGSGVAVVEAVIADGHVLPSMQMH